MGTWSTGSFGNDDASDFLSELQGVEDLSAIEHAIEEAEESGAELGADVAAAAVAACEVLAALLEQPGEDFEASTDASDWVDSVEVDVPASLTSRAVRVLATVLGAGSELRQLWQESGEYEVWRRSVFDLRSRLESA